jgi:hypothetical protein
MQNAGPILDYDTRLPWPPRTLRLEEKDGRVRVIFPVAPMWVYVLQIAWCAAVGLITLGGAITTAGLLWRVTYQIGQPPRNIKLTMRDLELHILVAGAIATLFWWGVAACSWYAYRTWGKVPRVLTATGEGLVLSRLRWWRLRERKWLLNEITGIQFRPININLHPWRTAADLYINRREGLRRLHFRLSSPDPHLPRQIAERAAAVLGFPLR